MECHEKIAPALRHKQRIVQFVLCGVRIVQFSVCEFFANAVLCGVLHSQKILVKCDYKFIAFLRLVGSVYKPADEQALEVVPAVQQATVQQPAVACQSTASTTTTFEVGNFDIGFSLSDDETEFDTSSNLFN